MGARRSESGQAAVEFVALLPLVALVAAVLWQGILAGQAVWLAGSAAHAASRAHAIGADGAAAARAALPGPLERNLRVRESGDGVAVTIAIPSVLGGERIGSVSARARMEPQR